MSTGNGVDRNPAPWQAMGVFGLSVTFAVGAGGLLAAVADARSWCCVHSWAMGHSTGLVVLLLFGLLGYHLVRGVGQRLGLLTFQPRAGWLPHIAYVASALGSFFSTELLTNLFMWVGLVASVATVLWRIRGRAVQPFGLGIIGLLVSALSLSVWLYAL